MDKSQKAGEEVLNKKGKGNKSCWNIFRWKQDRYKSC